MRRPSRYDPQRVGLAPGPVERQHQQARSRSRSGCAATSVSSSAATPGLTELQFGVEPLLHADEAQLDNRVAGAGGELLVGELGEGLAPPQRVGLGEQRHGAGEVAARVAVRPWPTSCSKRWTSTASGATSSA